MKIPSDNRWTQTNEGDLLGVLNETQNITFDKPGVAKLSKKPFKIYSSDDDADMSYILDISYFSSAYLALTDDRIFSFDVNTSTVSKITNVAGLGLNSDAQVIYGRYYVTTNTTVDYWNGSAWAGNQETLTSGVPHPMTVFDSLPTYKLSIGNGNSVIQLDSSGNTGQALTLPAQYQVTTLRYRNGYLYVGTKHLNGGEAKVFIWDGNTANANYEVPTGATWIFSMTEYGNTVAYITDKGDLSAVAGTSAELLAALPVYFDPNAIWQSSTGLTLNGRVMHEGMKTDGKRIYINIDADLASGYIPQMKSGLWVFDPLVGLYHRSMHSDDRFVSDGSITVSNSVITTSATHNLKTGDTVQFTNVAGLSGINDRIKYYVDVQSTTTFKIALSHKALLAGNYVTVSGTVTTDALIYVPNTDCAAGYQGTQGAVGLTTPIENQLEMWGSPIVWGARFDDTDGNAVYSLQGLTESWNIGRFTTQKITTDQIIQTWKNVIGFVKGVFLSNETVILKYKSEDKMSYPTTVIQGVWGNETDIHSVSTTFREDEWNDLEVGDEITVVGGYGRGYTTHIINIKTSGNTFVVTVDESIGTTNKTTYFYADNFKKVRPATSTKEFVGLLKWAWTVVKSPWIQLKVEMRGYETEFYMFDVDNSKER